MPINQFIFSTIFFGFLNRVKYIVFFVSFAAKGVKVSDGKGGKKGSEKTRGVEYDAMGSKWNKSMWDNMESE